MPEDPLPSIDDETMRRVYDIFLGQADADEWEALKDPALLPMYIKLIEDDGSPPFSIETPLDAETRAEIVENAMHFVGLLAPHEDQEAITALLKALTHDQDRLKVSAAMALAKLGARAAVEPMIATLESMVGKGELGGARRLAQCLGQIADERSKAGLERLLTQPRVTTDPRYKYLIADLEKAIKAINEAIP